VNRATEAEQRAGWWWAAVFFSAVLALVGVVRPEIALAAALIVSLGLGCAMVVYLGWQLFTRLRPQQRSEFAPAVYQRPPQVLPHHIARIAPDPNERNPALAAGARAGLVTVATERLWAGHGLNLHDPTHHDSIGRMLSPDLWAVIRPDRHDGRGNMVQRHQLHHRDLDRLLDDLESI
jgi:hypothetical protein